MMCNKCATKLFECDIVKWDYDENMDNMPIYRCPKCFEIKEGFK